MWALKAENLWFSYPNYDIFKNLDLELQAGEIRAVLGPSGSGKTTLIHLLAGILSIQKGRLWWGETEVSHLDEERLAILRRNNIGLIFQHHYLLDELTALENIMIPGLLAGKQNPQRAKELLARVGLEKQAHQLPAQLSGGERQRVAVARALFSRPHVVLADEPTGSLDRDNARRVRDALTDLAQENGAAVLFATHDEALVSGWRTWRLENGRLFEAS